MKIRKSEAVTQQVVNVAYANVSNNNHETKVVQTFRNMDKYPARISKEAN